MIVQTVQLAELPVTEITLIFIAVPGLLGCILFDIGITRHLDHGAGDDIVAIHLSDDVVDFLPIQTG